MSGIVSVVLGSVRVILWRSCGAVFLYSCYRVWELFSGRLVRRCK